MAKDETKLAAISAAEASSSATSKSKRKSAPREDEEDDSGSDSGSDVSMINVDFDFYNLNEEVDQIATKRLLRQTLSQDDELIDVHPLASFILSESVRTGTGTSIKTDGEESDPWALLAVLDMDAHRDKPALNPLCEYLKSVVPPTHPLTLHVSDNSRISPAFAVSTGLIFSLRLLNLPLPLIPHMYRMLLAEIKEARERRSLPAFTHYLLWGRGYALEGNEQEMGLGMNQNSETGKNKKKTKGQANSHVPLAAGAFPYHPEEEFIDKLASQVYTFQLKNSKPREDDSFGVDQFGRLVLIEPDALEKAVQAMEEACK